MLFKKKENTNIEERKLMEDVLLSLGRSDLVKYLRKNQSGHFINHLKKVERYEAVNDEDMNQSQYPNENGHEKNNLYQKFDLDEIDNGNVPPTQAIM